MPERVGFSCPVDLQDFCTQTNSKQSQEDGVQSSLTVNPWKEEAFSTIANFVLFWVGLSGLVSYLAETAVALPNTSLISEFSEAVGGMNTDSQLGKEIWKSFTRPRQ